MAEAFDPYHAWLSIASKDQSLTHYRLLDIDLFESAAEVIVAVSPILGPCGGLVFRLDPLSSSFPFS
jgi:hypothetical protein